MSGKTKIAFALVLLSAAGFVMMTLALRNVQSPSANSSSLRVPKPEDLGIVLPPEPVPFISAEEELWQQKREESLPKTAPISKEIHPPSSEVKRLQKDGAIAY